MQCIPSMGRPQLKVKFLSGINHQKSAGLNGAELIYTCPGPASKPLKYKICLFSFPPFFKPLHFYYPLKGTQKCLLVKRIKYLVFQFIPSSFTVIACVCRGHSSPHCKPRPGQRHQRMFRGAVISKHSDRASTRAAGTLSRTFL